MQLQGSTIGTGHAVVYTSEKLQFVMAGLAAPFTGYLSNRVQTRLLFTAALCCSAISSILLAFLADAWMVYLSYIFSGISLGMSFATSLAFFAQASPVSLIGPMLVFYFAAHTCLEFINQMTKLSLLSGIAQQQFESHCLFQTGAAIGAIILFWIGYREKPNYAERRLTLRSQFDFPRSAGFALALVYAFVQIAEGCFKRTIILLAILYFVVVCIPNICG